MMDTIDANAVGQIQLTAHKNSQTDHTQFTGLQLNAPTTFIGADPTFYFSNTKNSGLGGTASAAEILGTVVSGVVDLNKMAVGFHNQADTPGNRVALQFLTRADAGGVRSRLAEFSETSILLAPAGNINVGIGVATPGVALDVNGIIRASSGFSGTGGLSNFVGDLALNGNLIFTKANPRIMGDMTSALPNRMAWQSNVTNGATWMSTLPNGGSVSSGFYAYNNQTITNAGFLGLHLDGGASYIESGVNGAGNQLPMYFYVGGGARLLIAQDGTLVSYAGGAERFRVNSNSYVGINTSAPTARLDVSGTIRCTGQTVPGSGAGIELQWDGSETAISSYDRGSGTALPMWLQASYIDMTGNGRFGTSQNQMGAYFAFPARVGPQLCLYDGGGGNGYGIGINGSELSLFAMGSVGLRNNANWGARTINFTVADGGGYFNYLAAGALISGAGGDITANRGNNTGYVWLGNSSHYVGFDGGNYQFPSSWMYNQGQPVITQSNSGSFPFAAGPYTNDWFRVQGATGIYWSSYGIGWYVNDGGTPRFYQGSYNGEYVQTHSRNDSLNRIETGGNTTLNYTTSDGGCYNTGSYIYLPDLNLTYGREFWVKNMTGADFNVYVSNGNGIYSTGWVNPFTLHQGDSITVKASPQYAGWIIV
jgi:hypothetical protein